MRWAAESLGTELDLSVDMVVKGRITDWNDVRGFGFISDLKGSDRVFVHISAFPYGSRRPTEGEFVSYTLGTDERGRRCATDVTYAVRYAKRPIRTSKNSTSYLMARCVAAAFFAVVLLLVLSGRLWWPAACGYFVTSTAAFYAYKRDKEAALIRDSRTNEWTLILLGLIGGWPGALVARHRFRHKTKKVPFRIGSWLSVVLNVAGLYQLLEL